MYQEVVTFFTAFFGEGFDISGMTALFVCFAIMLIYGLLIRPWLNIFGGDKK